MSYPREHWSSRLGFIFAAVGSAIGLGLLWLFPYTVGENGGCLFLITYMICVVLIGIPVLVGELLMGRKSQRAAIGAFVTLEPKKPFWKIGGWFGVISSFLIMSFYSVIAGFGLSYILMSLTNVFKGMSPEQVNDVYDTLSSSGDIAIFWHFVFTAITMSIVFAGVRKGIEKWAKLMTRALLVILVALFFYSIRLEGFGQAVDFIFAPNWSEFHFSSVLEALGLAFFTLSLGQGIMISYGSYMKKDESIPRVALIVAVAVILVAILVALTIFPVVFTFGYSPQAGPGLIFKTLPYLFAQLPGTLIISTTFFVLFVFTALTSSIPFIEVVATNLMELLRWPRKKAVALTALGTFLFGIPSAIALTSGMQGWTFIYGKDFLATISGLVSAWLIPLGGLVTALFMGWVLDRNLLCDEFHTKRAKSVGFTLWRLAVRWVVPVLIFLIIVQKSGIF